jgi:hypothetical protein
MIAALFHLVLLMRDFRALKRSGFKFYFALAYCLGMIFSDLPSPAEASNDKPASWLGFAQAGNRFPLFGIMP